MFVFILTISEVIVFLILHYFVYCGLRWEMMPALLDFVGIWHGNLLTIYKLGNGRGGVRSCQTPFISSRLHQGTREDIIIEGVCALKNFLSAVQLQL